MNRQMTQEEVEWFRAQMEKPYSPPTHFTMPRVYADMLRAAVAKLKAEEGRDDGTA